MIELIILCLGIMFLFCGVFVIVTSANLIANSDEPPYIKIVFIISFLAGILLINVGFKVLDILLDENQTPQYNESFECLEESWNYTDKICMKVSKQINQTLISELPKYSEIEPEIICDGLVVDLNAGITIPQKVCTKRIKVEVLVTE